MSWPENTAFSPELPTFQLAWDSTSYKTFKECPYKYYLSVVLGYQPRKKSVHLAFGIAFHEACERYHRFRTKGFDKETAIEETVAAVYYRQLRTEEEKTFSSGWHEHALPQDYPTKTAHTLLRTIVWYLDQYGEDNLETVILPNGKPAVELSFSFEIDSSLSYCGHFDRIVQMDGKTFVTDYKTTTSQLDSRYFSQYSPDIQMTGYTLASQIVFDIPAKGIIVDAAQIAVTSSSFARMPVYRSAGQLEEFISDLKLDMQIARVYAEKNSWPQNAMACHHFSGCQFRGVCAHSPSIRKNFLAADFTKRIWNPLKER